MYVFGELLKQFRVRQGIKQQELADQLKVHRNTIVAWEGSEHPPKTREKVLELAKVLYLDETDTDQLLYAAGYPLEYQNKDHKQVSLDLLKEAKAEQELLLHIRLVDQSALLKGLLYGFVGRQNELKDIRKRIEQLSLTGGYLTITGDAGEGKSSIIAYLVKEYGAALAAHHFIPFKPGPDYQVDLLSNIMARLIIKHKLSHLYLAGDTRAALRSAFPRLLADIAKRGEKEVIFIDGLDQLKADGDGERDLSFLPDNPPSGVVFVLGTRPNDTLRPLELLKPQDEYPLPNLSITDFDLLLKHYGLDLEKNLIRRFYDVMQKNALYLDLAAKELEEQHGLNPEVLIQRMDANPNNIFSLSIERLKNPSSDWNEVIKPILGVFLVAREPLSLGHIRSILKLDADRLMDGIVRLGGLVMAGGYDRYVLYHTKFLEYLLQKRELPTQDYIFDSSDEKKWHGELVKWCELNNASLIWEDVKDDALEQERRSYARQHYVTHLYYAQEWQKLFSVLDTGIYGLAKVLHGSSVRFYAQDLDLGRQGASSKQNSWESGVKLLPYLWRYTLLRCSLASLADQYKIYTFEALILLGREQEAVGMAELLTAPEEKARKLLHIATLLRERSAQKQEHLQLLIRVQEIAVNLKEGNTKDSILTDLGKQWASIQQWERIEELLELIKDKNNKKDVLAAWGMELAKVQLWKQAAEIANNRLRGSGQHIEVLAALYLQLTKAQELEMAKEILKEIGFAINSLNNAYEKVKKWTSLGTELVKIQGLEQAQDIWDKALNCASKDFLEDLCYELTMIGYWDKAEKIVSNIQDKEKKDKAIVRLVLQLAKTKEWDRAEKWVDKVETPFDKGAGWLFLGMELTQVKEVDRALKVLSKSEAILSTIEPDGEVAVALAEIGGALFQLQQQEHALSLWNLAKKISYAIKYKEKRSSVLSEIGRILAVQQQLVEAKELWTDAKITAFSIKDSLDRDMTLYNLYQALADMKQWNEAWNIVRSFDEGLIDAEVLLDLGKRIAAVGERDLAEDVWKDLLFVDYGIDYETRLATLICFGKEIVKARAWEQLEDVLQKIKDLEDDLYSKHAAELLVDLCSELIKAHQWNFADELCLFIEDIADFLADIDLDLPENQDEEKASWDDDEEDDDDEDDFQLDATVAILQKLGTMFVHAQLPERAKIVWSKIENHIQTFRDEFQKASSLLVLCECFVLTRQWQRAKGVGKDIQDVVRTIKEEEPRVMILLGLSSCYVDAQQLNLAKEVWNEVEALANSLEKSDNEEQWYICMRILGRFVEVLVIAEQWEFAEKVALRIEDEDGSSRDKGLACLGTAFAKKHLWDQAQRIVVMVEDTRAKVKILKALVENLAEAQEWEHIEQLLKDIEDTDVKIEISIEAARCMAEGQQWSQAKNLCGEVDLYMSELQKDFNGQKLLSSYCSLLISLREWKHAEVVANTIDNQHFKVEILNELLQALSETDEYELLLEIIQNSWVRAETKQDAIELLPLATHFVHTYPELGVALYEGFNWVDNFVEAHKNFATKKVSKQK